MPLLPRDHRESLPSEALIDQAVLPACVFQEVHSLLGMCSACPPWPPEVVATGCPTGPPGPPRTGAGESPRRRRHQSVEVFRRNHVGVGTLRDVRVIQEPQEAVLPGPLFLLLVVLAQAHQHQQLPVRLPRRERFIRQGVSQDSRDAVP